MSRQAWIRKLRWLALLLCALCTVAFAKDEASYQYNKTGVLQGIKHNVTTTLNITSFSPTQGPPGTVVTLTGEGFAPTPAGNTVTLNGISAQVTQATPTSLTIVVPQNATTGTITVVVGALTAISRQVFTVAASTLPAITSFAPTSGPIGTRITIQGSNFDPVAANNQVTIGGISLSVISATTNQLVVEVGSALRGNTGGPITITNPAGRTVSASSFLVTGIETVDLGTLTVDNPTTPTTTFTVPANKIGVVRVPLTQGNAYWVRFTTTGGLPAGQVFTASGVALQNLLPMTTDQPLLAPETGSYQIQVPGGTTGGTVTMGITTATLLVPGSPLPVTSMTPSQTLRYVFQAEEGKGYGLTLPTLTYPGSSSYSNSINVYFQRSNDSYIMTCTMYRLGNCHVTSEQLPGKGLYVLQLENTTYSTANFSSVWTRDQIGSFPDPANSPDTVPVTTVNLEQLGQYAEYSFVGTFGQNLDLNISGNSIDGKLDVVRSDGSTLDSISLSSGKGAVIHMTLPETGNYRIRLAPKDASQGSVGLQLIRPATGTLAVDGTTPIILKTNQRGFYTFQVTEANRGYGLALSPLNIVPANGRLTIALKGPTPDSDDITSCTFSSADSCNLWSDYFVIPGTYTLIFEPPVSSSANFTVNLSRDTSSQLTVDNANDTAVVLNSRPGQNGILTFTGTAGQTLDLTVAGSTMTNTTYISVMQPDSKDSSSYPYSSSWAYTTIYPSSSDAVLHLAPLPKTGTYRIIFNPSGVAQGRINRIKLANVATGTLAVDGTTSITLKTNQRGSYTFQVTEANRGYGLALSPLSIIPANGSMAVYLDEPIPSSSRYINDCPLSSANSCNLWSDYFAVPGTYTLRFEPPAGSSASFTVNLSRDTSGQLAIDDINDTVVALDSRPGQNGVLTFNGTAGQSLDLIVAGSTITSSTDIRVMKPDSRDSYSYIYAHSYSGDLDASTVSPGSPDAILHLASLPETGTYRINFNPSGVAQGRISRIKLASIATGTLAVDGTTPITLKSNQRGFYTFQVTEANRGFGLAITPLSFTPATGGLTVSLKGATIDGNKITYCYLNSADSCNLWSDYFAIPGTYSLSFEQSTGSSASFTVNLSRDKSGIISLGVPTSVVIDRVGQNTSYVFAGTAGQNLDLNISGSSLAGTLRVMLPGSVDSGSGWASTSVNSTAQVLHLTNLPITGTYRVLIDGTALSTGAVTLQLSHVGEFTPPTQPPANGTITVNGNPLAVTIATGQTQRYTFTGSTGQYLSLGITSTSGNGTIALDNPQGGEINPIIGLSYCYILSTSPCIYKLPSDGTYTIRVVPSGSQAFSATLNLSSPVTGSLVSGTTSTVAFARAGQQARYTFSVQKGQPMVLYASNNTFTGYYDTQIEVRNSQDQRVYNTYVTPRSFSILSMNSSVTETWTVVVTSSNSSTGSINLLLQPFVTGTLNLDGTPTLVSLASGQLGSYTFTGRTGQLLRLGATLANDIGNAYLYNPQGGQIYSGYILNGKVIDFKLPSDGTYSFGVSPNANHAYSATLTLSSQISGSLVSGATSTVAIPRAGQQARYSFQVQGGQPLTLYASNSTIAGNTKVEIRNSQDQSIASSSVSTGGNSVLNLTPVATETWAVIVTPDNATTGSMNLLLRPQVTGTINPNGAPTAISLASGQFGRYTFTGSAGQTLGLGFTSVIGGSYYYDGNIYLENPQGEQIYSCTISNGNVCVFKLPSVGTYTFRVEPYENQSLSATLTMSSPVTVGGLASNTTTTVTNVRTGQQSSYTFQVQGGQPMTLYASNSTIVDSIWVEVYDGQNQRIASGSVSSNSKFAILNLTPVTTDNWTVVVTFYSAGTGSIDLLLRPYATGTLNPNGASTPISLASGQYGRYTFTGNTGQYLRLGGTVTSGVASTYLEDPQGKNIGYCFFSEIVPCTFTVKLPSDGTYSFRVMPHFNTDEAINGTFYLTNELQPTLVKNAAAVSLDARPGQRGIYPLTVTAGESMTIKLTSLRSTSGVRLRVVDRQGTEWLNCSTRSITQAATSCDFYPLYGGAYQILVEPQATETNHWEIQYTDTQ